MVSTWHDLPLLPAFSGPVAYAALPEYAAALHAAAGVARPPYDPECLANAIGVAVSRATTFDGNRGMLVALPNGTFRILVQKAEAPAAQRFTVAHELIELGLQVGCPTLVERSRDNLRESRVKERYCEVGAAEVLMPLAQVRQAALAAGGIESLLDLARLFGASLHAMLRRLVDASPTPCVGLIASAKRRHSSIMQRDVVYARANVTHSGRVPAHNAVPVLRVATVCGGGGLAVPVPAGTLLPEDGLLAACHSERRLVRGVERVSLGRLEGRFRVEAICPGYGNARHVYALLHPM